MAFSKEGRALKDNGSLRSFVTIGHIAQIKIKQVVDAKNSHHGVLLKAMGSVRMCVWGQ